MQVLVSRAEDTWCGMTDPLSKQERSARMSKVRGQGNKSTELYVETVLTDQGIQGWEKHPKGLPGKPDFYFPDYKLVVFVDGCFWHACPVCRRNTPHTRTEFWMQKIDENRRRDNRTHRKLRQQGYHVIRIWEHELKKKDHWLRRIRTAITKAKNMGSGSSLVGQIIGT